MIKFVVAVSICQQTCSTCAFCEGLWWSAVNTTGCASQYVHLGSEPVPIKGLMAFLESAAPYNHRNTGMVYPAVISKDVQLQKFRVRSR